MAANENFVVIGTPLPHQPRKPSQAPDSGRQTHSTRDLEVKDEHGRRRFHGAFTGGFSAGYYNTVGSAEGWTPSEFVSSRSNRSNIKSSRPEDFMDEEDKQARPPCLYTPSLSLNIMLSDATRITATDDFGTSGSAQRDLARKRVTAMNMQASGSILGTLSDAMIDDLIIPTSESIGARLLKRMGWKPGQGIGPRVSSRQRNPTASPLSDEDIAANVTFAPIDSAIILFANKSNHFGLGFNPHKDAPEFDVSAHAQSALGSRYLSGADSGATGPRLSFGLLNDSEDDEEENNMFGTGSKSQRRAEMEMDLDIAVSSDKRRKNSHGSAPLSNSRPASILVYCSDGRPPLAGFILTATKALDPKWYTAPIVPSNFSPRPIFISDGKTTSSSKQLGRSKLTADDRALILGETLIDAPRRSVFEYMSSENKNRLDGALGFVLDVEGEKHLRKDHWEVPSIERSAAEAALQGFIPFSDDISKQRRYKQYLNVQAGLSAEKIEKVEGFSGEDMNKELNEFVQAARIFKPLSTSMSSRFTTASKVIEFQQPAPGLRTGVEIQSSPVGKPTSEHKLVERMEVPKSQAAKAAEMGMFGPLTRSMADFYPNKLLCKRFNVPDPHPEHKDVGPDTAKDLLDKATMDSMMMEGSSVRSSPFKEAPSTTGLTDDGTVQEVEQEQGEPVIQVPQERPPMDIFKAIFDDSDSSSDSDVDMDADARDLEISPRRTTFTSRSSNRDSSEEFIGPPVAPTSAVESTFSTAEEPGRSGQGQKEAEDRDHEARRKSRSSKRHESLVYKKDESERSRSRKSRRERSSGSHRRSLSIEHNASKSRRRAEMEGNHSAASTHSDEYEHATDSSLRHKDSRTVRESSRRDDRNRDPTQERSRDRHAKAYEDEDDSDSIWVEKEVSSAWVEKETEGPGSADSTQAVASSRSRPRAAAFF
ncbi:hypothetical protein BKA57DRAFT_428190 [Linnemannia elongata]|nr:hypothetical protein BKA57DRAFT_428190 [Linnemannia elongata]